MAVKTTAKIINDTTADEIPRVKSVLPAARPETKRQVFFYGMIAADVFGFRNVERDSNMMSLSARLKEETGRSDGQFQEYYSERVSYIMDMHFNFSDEVPAEYKNIETWWNMVKDGNDPSECYVWYVSNVPNYITNLFGEVVDDSHKIWKPAAQQPITMEEQAQTDPN